MDNDKKIVAIYTRVSTSDQVNEGHSLGEQERRLRSLCDTYDYEVYKVYTDAGISGKSADNRPAYQQMLKDMRNNKFNLIMAYKMDRISRSISDFEVFFNEIKKYNCGIELLCEKINTNDAAGMMFARLLGVFAQFERELIKERTLVGVESAVKKGHFGGKPPLGYRHKIAEDGKTKLKEWEIYEEEANIVKEIFDLCSSGKTYQQISNILREKYSKIVAYVRTDKETGKKKEYYRQWTDASISVILNNKCYMGTYEHRKRVKDKDTEELVGVVPSIISEELFNDCQDMICRNGRNYYRSKKYLFMQILKCPRCGRILACNGTKKSNGTEYLYYKCKDCGVYLNEELIEQALLSKLNFLLELSTVINNDNLIIDSDIAQDFENCHLDHKLRYAIDESIIKHKLNIVKDNLLTELWNMASYEAKSKFIHTYIDNIVIKQYTNNSKKIKTIKVLDLKLKSHKVSELLDLNKKNLLDEIIDDKVCRASIAKFKKDTDALEYINILKKKYDFNIIENIVDREDLKDDLLTLTPWVFKIIQVRPSSVIEKNKDYGLLLPSNLNLLIRDIDVSKYSNIEVNIS